MKKVIITGLIACGLMMSLAGCQKKVSAEHNATVEANKTIEANVTEANKTK